MTRFSQRYWRSMHRFPVGLRERLEGTIAAIAADFPNLPAPNDETIKLPPTGAVLHRRRLPLSPFWVHYSLDAEGIVVQQVLVPLE